MLFRVIRQILEAWKMCFQLCWSTWIYVKIFFCIFGNWSVFCSLIVENFCVLSINSISVYLLLQPYRWKNLTQLLFRSICYWLSIYAHFFLKNLLIAGKGARILQCKVSVDFVNSNYLSNWKKMKKNFGLVLIIMQEQWTFHQETRQGHVSSLSLSLTNKQQRGREHWGVNQSKTIIRPPMLIQLKVTQNEKKNMLKLNSLTCFIHPVKKRKE